MDDEDLLCEWQAAREAYDEVLVALFSPDAGSTGRRPDAGLLREVTRRREVEEAARRRYHSRLGLADL